MYKKILLIFFLSILVGMGCNKEIKESSKAFYPPPLPPTALPPTNSNTSVQQIFPPTETTTPAINSSPALPDDTLPFRFIENYDYIGTLTVRGYAHIERNIPECGVVADCTPEELKTVPRYDYVTFIITKSDNKLFQDILEKKYHKPYTVGLGCLVANKQIKYINFKDADNKEEVIDSQQQIIEGASFNKIINSTIDKQIKLQFTVPYFSGGSEAPWCYTNYRNFKVVNSNFVFPSI